MQLISIPSLKHGPRGCLAGSGNLGEKADLGYAETPFGPYIKSMQQELEEPVLLMGIIMTLAVAIITC